MFIVFEGIDGSGKTTVSNRVAKLLRERGITIEHVREGGEFTQSVVRRMREFGKDRRNFELAPLAEVLLYLARDAQLLAESIHPAIGRGDVVFADRYLYSYDVLGCEGRGLPRETVRPLLDAVSGGIWPDLVVLCDVDPHLARARRKSRKISRSALGKFEESTGGSRKGLSGVGMLHRIRDGYLALAERERDRWLVADNSFADLDELVERVAGVIAAMIEGSTPRRAATAGRKAAPAIDRPTAAAPTPDAATEAFYRFVSERVATEPGVAAYFLSGLDDDRSWSQRDELVDAAPAEVAYSIRGVGDERAWDMRERLMAAAPYQVAHSVTGRDLEPNRAHAMRMRLVDEQPRAVLSTIRGDVSAEAWTIRRRLAGAHPVEVVGTLALDDGRDAWTLRDALIARPDAAEDPALAGPIARSVRGLGTERAWAVRRAMFDAAPIAVLGSLSGVFDDESWEWRARYVERAGKAVMGSFNGSEDPRAWELRRAHAPRIKEAVDSIIGLDGDAAWALRDEIADVWPSTALKTVVPLARMDRSERLAARLLERYPTNLSLLKHATRIASVKAEGAALEVVV